jgi:hypothetical protein
MFSKSFWKRNGRRLACVAVQCVMVVGTVAMGAYLMCRSDCGKVVTHELLKGLAGGVIGGLAVGAFLAVRKLGA